MKKVLLALIRGYQMTFSPDHGVFSYGRFTKCRFYPSCSEYAYESINKHGILRGSRKAAGRILRCGPWSAGGYDPIESNHKT